VVTDCCIYGIKRRFEEIAPIVGIDIKSKYFPKRPNQLTRMINTIMHTLKEAGIEIKYGHDTTGKKRLITIRKVSSESSDRQNDENQAQKQLVFSDDTSYDISNIQESSKASSVNSGSNQAQNTVSDDTYGSYDDLHTDNIKQEPEIREAVESEYQGTEEEV